MSKIEPKEALDDIIDELKLYQSEWDNLEFVKVTDADLKKRKKWLSERRLAIFKALDQLENITKILQVSKVSFSVERSGESRSAFVNIPYVDMIEEEYTLPNGAKYFHPVIKNSKFELVSSDDGITSAELIAFKTWLDNIYSRYPKRSGYDCYRWAAVHEGDGN